MSNQSSLDPTFDFSQLNVISTSKDYAQGIRSCLSGIIIHNMLPSITKIERCADYDKGGASNCYKWTKFNSNNEKILISNTGYPCITQLWAVHYEVINHEALLLNRWI